ncbi:MAG: FAD-dependent monooxygenase [Acidobacteria bacterium]|nr:FAD-dependent monooxygenase [Acidobacteriota bacterium]
MTTGTPVCIIGAGPIGMTGALLLSRLGVRTLLVERRGELNTHPRSRFVDTNTMELMRELGLEKEVEDTGLGPDWTECNRWFDALTGTEYARIPCPTFHTVPRDTSPVMPVMTCQDYVEKVLLAKIRRDPNIDVRFHTVASGLRQDESGTRLRLRDARTDGDEEVAAEYAIGADGPGSSTRAAIDTELDAEPRPVNMQDVIFDADLSEYVRERKAPLLYANPGPRKMMVFQPLDGVRRWRCQMQVPEPRLISERAVSERIRAGLGAAAAVPLEINSMSLWQPTPGCTTRLSRGRIFLAGDAAHVAIPTGGMGNNTGFSGIRNLAWKLAYVLRGISPPAILETYEEEHRPLARQRIDAGVRIYEAMAVLMRAYMRGEDLAEAIEATRLYGNYDGLLMGCELRSGLLAVDDGDPPLVDHPVIDFAPVVRSGRRAPHLWLDDARKTSVLDAFGLDYTLLLGAGVDGGPWDDRVERLSAGGFPIKARALPRLGGDSHYSNDGVVLVRPDGVIADHWRDAEVPAGEKSARLSRLLPRAGS